MKNAGRWSPIKRVTAQTVALLSSAKCGVLRVRTRDEGDGQELPFLRMSQSVICQSAVCGCSKPKRTSARHAVSVGARDERPLSGKREEPYSVLCLGFLSWRVGYPSLLCEQGDCWCLASFVLFHLYSLYHSIDTEHNSSNINARGV